MTALSFRVADGDAADAQAWAVRLGVPRSELLREALRHHLAQLANEHELGPWLDSHSAGKAALAEVVDFGPAEDWSDWVEACRVLGATSC